MKSLIQDHAAREALHEEVHARPPPLLSGQRSGFTVSP